MFERFFHFSERCLGVLVKSGFSCSSASSGVSFPAELKSIARVEQQNSLSINVFGYEEFVYPLYLSSRDGDPINLLLISKVVDGETRSHYVWVKNINALLYDQNKHKARTSSSVSVVSAPSTPKHHSRSTLRNVSASQTVSQLESSCRMIRSSRL